MIKYKELSLVRHDARIMREVLKVRSEGVGDTINFLTKSISDFGNTVGEFFTEDKTITNFETIRTRIIRNTNFDEMRNVSLPYPFKLTHKLMEQEKFFNFMNELGKILGNKGDPIQAEIDFIKSVADGKRKAFVSDDTEPYCEKLSENMGQIISTTLGEGKPLNDETTIGDEFKGSKDVVKFIEDVDNIKFDMGLVEHFNDEANRLDKIVQELNSRLSFDNVNLSLNMKGRLNRGISTLAVIITRFGKLTFLLLHFRKLAKIIPSLISNNYSGENVYSESTGIGINGFFSDYSGFANESSILGDFEKKDLTNRDLKVLLNDFEYMVNTFTLMSPSFKISNDLQKTYELGNYQTEELDTIPSFNKASILSIRNTFITLLDKLREGIMNPEKLADVDSNLPIMNTPRTKVIKDGYSFKNIIEHQEILTEIYGSVSRLKDIKPQELVSNLTSSIFKSDDLVINSDKHHKAMLNLVLLFRKTFFIFNEYISPADKVIMTTVVALIKAKRKEALGLI